MSISTPFIERPVATTLLTIALTLAGGIAYFQLPVAALPQVDFPTINVSASLPGGSPEVMAATIATPLEKQFTRIAGVTEMTSRSSVGSAQVTLQFDLGRDINAAARDVQAAINAAAGFLPSNLPSKPSYKKQNPADQPILILAMTSNVVPRSQFYDIASSVFAQKLAQIEGVGQVQVSGSSLPAVRVEVNPQPVSRYNVGLDQIGTFLQNANANKPKGSLDNDRTTTPLMVSDQLLQAKDYQNLVVVYRNGAPVRLSDLGRVIDSVEDVRNLGMADGQPAVLIQIRRQPAANVVDVVKRIKDILPRFKATLPVTVDFRIENDRTITIRNSVRDAQRNMVISIGLVILVVFIFLRNGWATFIPSISVPVSLIATFSAMYLLGYNLDNLSLMGLTIATGFVVDDAIVVIENITRHIEGGMPAMRAALKGAEEIGFTVVSMSISLIAVFIPILMMPRNHRPPVPRVRDRTFRLDLRLADHLPDSDADDVFAPAQGQACARPHVQRDREVLPVDHLDVRVRAAGGFAPSGADSRGDAAHGRRHRLSVRQDPQRIFPAAGYRASAGTGAGPAAHLLSGAGGKGKVF